MNKLEKAVNTLIKAAAKVHPLIHALKQSAPKAPRKPRTRRPKMYDGASEAAEAIKEISSTTTTAEDKPVVAESKKRRFAKGSQEAKDFMNMLRLRRKGKK